MKPTKEQVAEALAIVEVAAKQRCILVFDKPVLVMRCTHDWCHSCRARRLEQALKGAKP